MRIFRFDYADHLYTDSLFVIANHLLEAVRISSTIRVVDPREISHVEIQEAEWHEYHITSEQGQPNVNFWEYAKYAHSPQVMTREHHNENVNSKRTITVDSETYVFLMELSKELNSQNHRSTRMPYFFQIKSEQRITTVEGNGTKIWIKDGGSLETEEEINSEIYDIKRGSMTKEEINELDDFSKENILEEDGWSEWHYEIGYKFENSFLTAKACKRHIEGNGHHYTNPVDYLIHAFRNPEMEKLMKFICELTGNKLHI